MRHVGVAKKRKKGLKLSCVKLAICPDHPRRHRPLKFCIRGRVQEVVYISSFTKIGRGVSELWRIENLPLPLTLTWPMAYTTACTTVQAVIQLLTIRVTEELHIYNSFDTRNAGNDKKKKFARICRLLRHSTRNETSLFCSCWQRGKSQYIQTDNASEWSDVQSLSSTRCH